MIGLTLFILKSESITSHTTFANYIGSGGVELVTHCDTARET
jgi:hypothetical protein